MTEVDIPMRDGTLLRADIHLPETGLSHPAVLLRTPYDKGRDHPELAVDAYLRAGFAAVLQDTRGRYRSEGSHYHGRDDEEDGYDTLEWLAAQPWCDGRIGMTGISYPAAAQCAAACSGTSKLGSMFHVQAPSSYYLNGARRGGTLLGYWLGIELLFACTSPEAKADPVLEQALRGSLEDLPAWLRRLPLREGQNPLSAIADIERYFLDVQEHVEFDDFWTENRLWSPEEHLDEFADVPMLLVGGWYDLYREDRLFTVMRGRKQAPLRLVMGPWGHGSFGRRLGDVDFGAEAEWSAERFTSMQLDWFKETLTGDAPPAHDSPVRVFVMGGGSGARTPEGLLDHGGHWRSARDWPLPEAQPTPFYLRPGGRLTAGTPPVESAGPTPYLHDPENPVPTTGGTNYFVGVGVVDALQGKGDLADLGKVVPYGPQDQREAVGISGDGLPLCARNDVIAFETPPLAADVELIGPIEATLWLSSSARDTDIVLKLIDVYPPSADYPHGYAMNLCDGVLRASHRDGFAGREPLEPDAVYELRLGPELIYPVCNRFVAGHRIRLQIASSDFPAYDVNPGHGLPSPSGGVPRKALNRVFHDPERPSHVVLPLMTKTAERSPTTEEEI